MKRIQRVMRDQNKPATTKLPTPSSKPKLSSGNPVTPAPERWGSPSSGEDLRGMYHKSKTTASISMPVLPSAGPSHIKQQKATTPSNNLTSGGQILLTTVDVHEIKETVTNYLGFRSPDDTVCSGAVDRNKDRMCVMSQNSSVSSSLEHYGGTTADGTTKEDVHGRQMDVVSHSTTTSTRSVISGSSSCINSISALPRQFSKIPATSPKRVSRDIAGGLSNSKGRQRVDSEGRPKTRFEFSSKTPFRDNAKARNSGKGTEELVVGKHDPKVAPRVTSHGDHGNGRISRRAVEFPGVREATGQSLRDDRSVTPSSILSAAAHSNPGNTDGKKSNESRSKVLTARGEPIYQGRLIAYDNTHLDVHRTNRHPPDQSHQPVHGILKDSGYGYAHNPSMCYNQEGKNYPFSDATILPKENPYYHVVQHPARSTASGGSSDPLYQQVDASRSRTSRSTTPENVYSYGSLYMRSHGGTLTQQSAHHQDKTETWKPAPHKAESESGFSVGSIERENMDNNYAVINYKKSSRGVTEYTNQTYGIVSHVSQPPRPDSLPACRRGSPDSMYSVVRPGSVPPQYYSDTESGGHPPRRRAGSVPIGYESDSAVHGVVASEHPRHGNLHGIYGTSSLYAGGKASSVRGEYEVKHYRSNLGKRSVSRRHTVGSQANKKNSNGQETEKKREAFMQLLAQRYPQYADKIQGTESSPVPQSLPQDRPSRAREGQRRRTAVVTYNPNQATNVLEYDDVGTMSDLELPSFQRGGFVRTSMPIVRSASTSLEKPLGLVFLVYGDQTKKSMLPNEITTLDTVRALFVRAFPDLTLEMLEDARKKIYLLDPATNIYFQLEDLMDIKDRSVLKIHETDNEQPQKVKERQEVRGRTVQMPVARSHTQQVYAELPLGHEVYAKSQSLPVQATQNYPEMMQEQHSMWEIERRSRSRTPEASDRPRSLSAGSASRQRFSHSPDRLPTPERVPLNPIPENRQVLPGYRGESNYYETVGPGTYRGQYPSGIYESPAAYQGYPPSSPGPAQQTYIARSTRAPTIAHPQRAVAPGSDIRDSSRGSNANRHSLAFAPMTPGTAVDTGSQHTLNYHVPPADRGGSELSRSTTPADDMTRNRIEKMEQQLANLTAWVHYQKDGTRRESVSRSLGSTTSDGSDTLPASSTSKYKGETPSVSNIATTSDHVALAQGLSDIHNGFGNQRSSGLNSRESTPLSAQTEISTKLAQLRNDLHILRRQQQLNMEAMRDEFMAASIKIKKVLASVPGAQNQVNFYKRNEATNARRNYTTDKERVEKELSDLEASVEELRADVISRQCRVNTSDVEGMALLLSNITKSLADLKAQFPEIQGLMKGVMDAELRVVVSEEKFLKEEPTEIEHCLKRCKKITGTLYTLKRLASVQDHRPPHVPNMAPTTGGSLCDQKKVLLDNIRALVPDHEQRVKEMEAADASRERKKKITSQQQALKFGKSIELATKNLRPPSLTDVRGDDVDEVGDVVKGYQGERGGQSDQAKPVAPTKPTVSSSSPTTHLSSAAMISLASTSVKTSFPSSTVLKQSDKPTATVSAMTAGVSDTITMMARKTVEKESGTTIPLTQTTDCLSGAFLGRTETHSIKVGTESPKKKDATVYTYQISGTVNPVFPVSTAIRPENIDGLSSKTLEFQDKLTSVHSNQLNSNANMHSDLHNSDKKVIDQPFATNNGDSISPANTLNEHPDSIEKALNATYRQAARSAFFSSLNTPPDSPSMGSPNRNLVGIEIGPDLSPGGQSEKAAKGNTAKLAMSGTATPKSPTSSSTLPSEMTGSKTASSLQNSPTRGIPRPATDSKPPSQNIHLPTGSESTNKQKKVPPPPPPRKDSRPTSANISPVNGGPLDFSVQQSHDMPHFIGGILGQHRLSGGPLFSTPKPIPQQKPASKFEQDIASGIYANMNRPDVQSQKNTPQQMIHAANIPSSANSIKDPPQSYNNEENMCIPPPPSVTIALDREERGSSSESSSSSSGTSMGSQQSVISVIKSPSASDKASSKAKPDPPKRQSSLLAKFTGSKESKSKMNNGKAKVSGVDL